MTERIPLAPLLAGEVGCTVADLAHRIESGAVFICPTDTIYGIGGRADSADVERRIRSVKERRSPAPFILLAADRSRFEALGLRFTGNAALLANRFWPGPVTLVLPALAFSAGVGVRVSSHPFVTALDAKLGMPIFSTSANLSDSPYVNDPDAIFSAFQTKVDFMVDAGVLPESRPSTVVRVNADDSLEILREGAVAAERIFQTIRNPD
ncbi:MAG TPA: L-threonylcarbamoyladenylate synthase [Chitinivibrionales bacterium]|nr:L-threonylcarbamoyladenylate synthase [Chitinivibrionales bacterium]